MSNEDFLKKFNELVMSFASGTELNKDYLDKVIDLMEVESMANGDRAVIAVSNLRYEFGNLSD